MIIIGALLLLIIGMWEAPIGLREMTEKKSTILVWVFPKLKNKNKGLAAILFGLIRFILGCSMVIISFLILLTAISKYISR